MDYRTPFGTRELAAETESSPAMISRVSSLLEADEIVTKESPRGPIVSVDWEALASRWAVDYDFAASNTLTAWLEPRGTTALFARLREAGFPYSVTGSFAAYRLAPFAEPRLASLYVDDPEAAAQSLGTAPGGYRRQCSPRAPIRPCGVRAHRMRRRHNLCLRNPGPARPHEGTWARADGGRGPLGVDAGQ